jgi:Flp pilus assembly protein TadD
MAGRQEGGRGLIFRAPAGALRPADGPRSSRPSGDAVRGSSKVVPSACMVTLLPNRNLVLHEPRGNQTVTSRNESETSKAHLPDQRSRAAWVRDFRNHPGDEERCWKDPGMRICFYALLSLVPAAAGLAQGPGDRSLRAEQLPGMGVDQGERNGSVHGQINSENMIVGALTVELSIPNRAGIVKAPIEGGSFDFRGLAPGQYQLQLSGAAGQVVYEQSVLITGGYQNLTIEIPTKTNVGKSGGATVSIRQLQHKVPSEAQKEFGKGMKASNKGNHTLALEHFQKATQIDPEFSEAFNSTGVSDMELGNFKQAADQFQKAVDLVPDYPVALANLSGALCRSEQYREAAEVARRALKLDPGRLKVRYVLGFSLASVGGNQAEALDNLQRAATEIPTAHLLAAKILVETDRRGDAAKQLEDYLHSSAADSVDRQKIEAWLEQLRR